MKVSEITRITINLDTEVWGLISAKLKLEGQTDKEKVESFKAMLYASVNQPLPPTANERKQRARARAQAEAHARKALELSGKLPKKDSSTSGAQPVNSPAPVPTKSPAPVTKPVVAKPLPGENPMLGDDDDDYC